MKSLRTLAFVAAVLSLAIFASAGNTLDQSVAADDLEAIKAMGPSVMPRLARMYGRATRSAGSAWPASSIAWAGSPKKRKTR